MEQADTQFNEYLTCQERGHQSDGRVTGYENYSEYTCKYCGVRYFYEPQELVEINPPQTATPDIKEDK